MPPRRLRSRRRGGAQSARAHANRVNSEGFEGYHGLPPPHTDIRPTHVCKYGYRWELPARPALNRRISVRLFRPSGKQRQLRCDGCARSHQTNAKQMQCFANHQSELDAIIQEGDQYKQPDDTPLGHSFVFYSLTHNKAGAFIGKITRFDMGRNYGQGKDYKGGKANIVVTRIGL